MVAVRAPTTIETNRLILRKPVTSDAEAVFAAYASDRHSEFPNLEAGAPRDVLCYATVLARGDIV